jgi:hypothetical protein
MDGWPANALQFHRDKQPVAQTPGRIVGVHVVARSIERGVGVEDAGDVVGKCGGFGEPHRGSTGVAGRVSTSKRSGACDSESDDLAQDLSSVSLSHRDAKHGEVDAGVWPRPGLGEQVCAFE